MSSEKSSGFSSRMREFRRTQNLTQEALGEMLGVSGRYIGALEKGEKDVEESSSIYKLFEIFEANKVPNNPIESDLSVKEELGFYGLSPRLKLRVAREAKGFGVAEFAKKLGYSVSVYQDIESGSSRMGEKMILKAAKLLGMDPTELMEGADEPPSRNVPFGSFGAIPEVKMGPGMEGVKPKFVPLLSMAQCGAMHAYSDGAYTGEGFLAYSPEDPNAFAVKLTGDSMQPKIDPGDVAVIYPSKQPRNGTVVLAKLDDDHGGDVMVKVYQAAKDQVTLSSYNPAHPALMFPRSAFAWIYPVNSVTKVFS